LPMRKRIEIIGMHMNNVSERDIARALEVSKGAVEHWIENWEAGGDLSEQPKKGRPVTATRRVFKAAQAKLLRPGFGGLAAAARELHSRGHTPRVLHKSTLSRMLRDRRPETEKAIVPRFRRPTRALSAYDMSRRALFAKLNQSRDWDNVMFTDRKKFYLWYPGSQVQLVQWVEKGESYQVTKANKPLCVNVYVGITRYGTTGMLVVSGTSKHKSSFKTKAGKDARNITGAEYQRVLTAHLLPHGAALMRLNGHKSWVFQQDNDPAHSQAEAVIRTYNKRHNTNIKLLQGWPPHSPDLSPIENMWADVQRRLDRAGCKTFPDFVGQLESLIANMGTAWLERAYAGMHQRIVDTINLRGGMTRH